MQLSVSICVYKNDNFLHFKEALESIVKQSLQPNQIVLVVDGKIDNKLQNVIDIFIERTKQLSIIFDVIYLEKNVGHGEARKISIENAKNELVALMDADDISHYNRFKKQVSMFEKNQRVSIVGGQILEIAHNTKKPIGKREVPLYDKEIKEYLKKRCPFNQVTVMFKKEDVLKAGNYIDFYHNEDYYLWIRMYMEGFEFCNLEDILVDVRVNETFYNRRGGFKYFLSEFKIQRIMYKNGIISFLRFIFNSSIRFVLQVLLTDYLRGLLFKKLARKGVEYE
jgi:glycosyltransferase involved in cell wall biosynthesis